MTSFSDVRIFFCTTPTNMNYSFDRLIETIYEITACADQSCEELQACLLGSYCGFFFSDGELPAPPMP